MNFTLQPEAPPARSPLRYAGGKGRAVKWLRELLPPNLRRLVSPFLGGGGFELDCAARGIEVLAADAYEPLINFWQVALEDAAGLADFVEQKYPPPLEPEFYRQFYDEHQDFTEPKERAAAFYILNRNSWGGLGLSAGKGIQQGANIRYSPAAIDRLRRFKAPGLRLVGCQDWRETLEQFPEDFLFCDPPYMGVSTRLYGKSGDMQDFPHEDLRAILGSRRGGFLLCYKDLPEARELYEGFPQIAVQWQHDSVSRPGKVGYELLITDKRSRG